MSFLKNYCSCWIVSPFFLAYNDDDGERLIRVYRLRGKFYLSTNSESPYGKNIDE